MLGFHLPVLRYSLHNFAAFFCSPHPMRALLCSPLSEIFSNFTLSERKINFPVALIHGFSDIPGLSGTWAAVKAVLREEAGVPKSDILTVQIPPFDTIEQHTKSAIRDITAKFPGKTVHLITHSMVLSIHFWTFNNSN